ncbi:MAG TPA: amino acid permease [Phycisphaerales bacterium]|nr:amino acid permease [Phycisphaerales bacterium]
MTATTSGTNEARRDLPRTIGTFGALGIMLGTIIGSGIFRTPSEIAQHLSSPVVMLLMWAVGGLLSLFGALTFTELAVVFPRSGGLYNFLYHGLGRSTAFVFGWTYMLISKPFAAGAISTIFAQYLHLNSHYAAFAVRRLGMPEGYTTVWAEPAAVCAVLIALTALNARGMRLGAGAGVVVTSLKVAALVSMCLFAVVVPGGDAANFAPADEVPKSLLLALAPVMAAVLWTYEGWADVGAVAGEVKDPQRTLPRVNVLGTLLAVGLYIAINAAYFYVLPIEQVRASTSVAGDVMAKLLGPAGGVLLTAMVVVSTLGSTHASIITGARVTFAQSQDRLLFRFLSRVHPRYETPHVSLWLQCALSCTAVLFFRDFATLAGGFVFTIWIFYGLAAFSVIRLRVTRPELERPYRTPWYPVVPVLFILSAVGMTVLEVVASAGRLRAGEAVWWETSLLWIVVLLAGYPVFYVWDRWWNSRPTFV